MTTGPGGAGKGNRSYSFSDKLGFLVWGIRYFDIMVLCAFPNLGAVLALPDLSIASLKMLLFFNAFNVLYITHIFIYNDISDARINPWEPAKRNRHALKRPVLSERELLVINFALLAVSLAGFLVISTRLFLIALVIEALTYLYSQRRVNLKGIPLVSLLIHFAGSSLYLLGGWVVYRDIGQVGIFLAVFIGVVLVAGHFSNEIDDFEQDMAVGIRTNAIAFGRKWALRAGLILFAASSAWFALGSLAWLDNTAYFWLGLGLLIVWLAQAWNYRSWKAGDPISDFRGFYRMAYALFTLMLFAIKFVELAGSLRY